MANSNIPNFNAIAGSVPTGSPDGGGSNLFSTISKAAPFLSFIPGIGTALSAVGSIIGMFGKSEEQKQREAAEKNAARQYDMTVNKPRSGQTAAYNAGRFGAYAQPQNLSSSFTKGGMDRFAGLYNSLNPYAGSANVAAGLSPYQQVPQRVQASTGQAVGPNGNPVGSSGYYLNQLAAMGR